MAVQTALDHKQMECAMHPFQIIVAFVMALFGLMLVVVFGLGLFMVLFPNAIKYNPDSRLIRWPDAVKKSWFEFWDFIDIITNGHRARKVMREIFESG